MYLLLAHSFYNIARSNLSNKYRIHELIYIKFKVTFNDTFSEYVFTNCNLKLVRGFY